MKLYLYFIIVLIIILAATSIPFVIRHENKMGLLETNETLCKQAQMKAWEIGYRSGQVSAMTGGFNFHWDSLEMAKIIYK